MMASAAFVLAGCNQGGTLDDYGTDSGTSGTNTNYRLEQSGQGTNGIVDPMNQGGSTSPGGMSSGSSTNAGLNY